MLPLPIVDDSMRERVPIRTALGTQDEGFLGYDYRTDLSPMMDELR